jgi:hypothetical protein
MLLLFFGCGAAALGQRRIYSGTYAPIAQADPIPDYKFQIPNG